MELGHEEFERYFMLFLSFANSFNRQISTLLIYHIHGFFFFNICLLLYCRHFFFGLLNIHLLFVVDGLSVNEKI